MAAKLFERAACAVACAALALAVVPSSALAGENATSAQIERNHAAIRETISALDSLEEGSDYSDDEILVTYSGQDEAQLVELDEGETVRSALEDAAGDSMVVAAQPNYRYRLLDTVESPSTAGAGPAAAASDPLSSE